MHFDDRLATVLRHRAGSARAAQTQFRQLLDLLGNRARGADQSLLAAAWLRLGALGEQIGVGERAAMIEEGGWRFRNAELAAHLAEDEPPVAAAALARASLTDEEWQTLIPRLPIRARGFLRLRRDLPSGALKLLERLGVRDRGLPEPDTHRSERLAAAAAQEELAAAPNRPAGQDKPTAEHIAGGEDSQIGALVRRIEQFRLARSVPAKSTDGGPGLAAANDPRLPLNEPQTGSDLPLATGFSFTADTAGRIEWATPAVAPMVVGMLIPELSGTPRTFRPGSMRGTASHRQPVRGAAVPLRGSPIIAGDWVLDAMPRFADGTGGFAGYAGKFRKPQEMSVAAQDSALTDNERIRQVLHELRTPVNAIQGFAEVIQQQLFGPVPHEYRALAANVAGDSARMLAGFDELDRLAKLETSALELAEGTCNIAAIMHRQSRSLHDLLSPRMAGLEWTGMTDEAVTVPLTAGEAEALTWRLLATLAGTTGAGETVQCSITTNDTTVRIACGLPGLLSAEDDVFEASIRANASGVSAGFFGAGFAMRLVRAEARAAGGDLTASDGEIILTLPNLTGAAALDSELAG